MYQRQLSYTAILKIVFVYLFLFYKSIKYEWEVGSKFLDHGEMPLLALLSIHLHLGGVGHRDPSK